CKTCLNACIYGGLAFINGRAVMTDQCRACGRCVTVCPQGAIQISMSEESVQATIDLLEPRVDVT
ncbi:MAG: 4Fe-4S binding protein, partial [Syntrophales bacterium]|nr:4Fe-4S binding protein [Syntrophales bacterium]